MISVSLHSYLHSEVLFEVADVEAVHVAGHGLHLDLLHTHRLSYCVAHVRDKSGGILTGFTTSNREL